MNKKDSTAHKSILKKLKDKKFANSFFIETPKMLKTRIITGLVRFKKSG